METDPVESPPLAPARYSTIREIITAAGGPAEVIKALDGVVTREAVYKWPKIGIPDRHWAVVMKLCDVTPTELYEANLAARGQMVEASN